MTEAEWLTIPDPQRLSLYLAETASARKLRLLAAACCRRLLAWNKQSRALEALRRVEQFADGQLASSTMEKWSREMWRAMGSRGRAQYVICWAVSVACDPRQSPEFVNDWQAMVRLAVDFRPELLQGLPTLVRVTLHEIFGNPFRSVTLDPSWLTPTVTGLALAIYDERSFDCMPILADALEEAGCANADMLQHCRQPGEHVRGCWVIDQLLGKE